MIRLLCRKNQQSIFRNPWKAQFWALFASSLTEPTLTLTKFRQFLRGRHIFDCFCQEAGPLRSSSLRLLLRFFVFSVFVSFFLFLAFKISGGADRIVSRFRSFRAILFNSSFWGFFSCNMYLKKMHKTNYQETKEEQQTVTQQQMLLTGRLLRTPEISVNYLRDAKQWL